MTRLPDIFFPSKVGVIIAFNRGMDSGIIFETPNLSSPIIIVASVRARPSFILSRKGPDGIRR